MNLLADEPLCFSEEFSHNRTNIPGEELLEKTLAMKVINEALLFLFFLLCSRSTEGTHVLQFSPFGNVKMNSYPLQKLLKDWPVGGILL